MIPSVNKGTVMLTTREFYYSIVSPQVVPVAFLRQNTWQIAPGSVIYSDQWPPYRHHSAAGFLNGTVITRRTMWITVQELLLKRSKECGSTTSNHENNALHPETLPTLWTSAPGEYSITMHDTNDLFGWYCSVMEGLSLRNWQKIS